MSPILAAGLLLINTVQAPEVTVPLQPHLSLPSRAAPRMLFFGYGFIMLTHFIMRVAYSDYVLITIN